MFCTNCGQKIEDGAKFCQYCGSPAQQESAGTNTSYTQPESIPEYNADGFDKDDIESNKLFAMFSYIGFLFIVPLIIAPDSQYARFHANQGINLFVAQIICGLVCTIPVIGWVLGGIAEVASVVLVIIGILNAVTGNAKELPIVGKYRILK